MVPIVAEGKAQGFIAEIRKQSCSIGHDQAGHSLQIAERAYARTLEELYDMGQSTLHNYRQFSNRWHELLCLSAAGKEAACDGEVRPLKKPKLSHSDHLKISEQQVYAQSKDGNPVSSAEAISLKRSQNEKGVLETQIGFDYGQVLNGGSNFRGARQKLSSSGTVLVEEDHNKYEHMLLLFLTELRSMLKDPCAKFKSQIQYNVTTDVSETRENVFAVIPTGSRKSLCMLFPTFMARGSLSTIIIVPPVSFVREFKLRASKLQISTCTSIPSPDQADLYILTPEKVRSEAFTQLISRLMASASLARVVIDEAHLTRMWSNFRQAQRDIRYALIKIPSSIPRVLLSATVPPTEGPAVIAVHGERRAIVFSMPTVRKNLEFSV
ncbi:DEAD/DEAH box helicase [Gracilaria domingensis]|nr:DEAD/DEAH box helicase [Gracilaria domingensis]